MSRQLCRTVAAEIGERYITGQTTFLQACVEVAEALGYTDVTYESITKDLIKQRWLDQHLEICVAETMPQAGLAHDVKLVYAGESLSPERGVLYVFVDELEKEFS